MNHCFDVHRIPLRDWRLQPLELSWVLGYRSVAPIGALSALRRLSAVASADICQVAQSVTQSTLIFEHSQQFPCVRPPITKMDSAARDWIWATVTQQTSTHSTVPTWARLLWPLAVTRARVTTMMKKILAVITWSANYLYCHLATIHFVIDTWCWIVDSSHYVTLLASPAGNKNIASPTKHLWEILASTPCVSLFTLTGATALCSLLCDYCTSWVFGNVSNLTFNHVTHLQFFTMKRDNWFC